MSKTKGGGSTRNGRDSNSQRLGVKVFDGTKITAGTIIVRQRGTKLHPGKNVGIGGDDTLFSLVDGDNVFATADELGKASVTGKIVGTAQGPKINGFTYKKKTNQRRRYGHRQHYTVVEITSITTS